MKNERTSERSCLKLDEDEDDDGGGGVKLMVYVSLRCPSGVCVCVCTTSVLCLNKGFTATIYLCIQSYYVILALSWFI